MNIYDISQPVFGCRVYPGDKEPRLTGEMRMEQGDLYNLSYVEMGVHNGTHIDAPFHFICNGDTIEKIPLEKTVGYCYVSCQNNDIYAEKAVEILNTAEKENTDCTKRILIKGSGIVTSAAAKVFADAGVYLIGVEGLSVGPVSQPLEVHKILLSKKVVLLEGLVLKDIAEGVYFLSSAPLLLNGSDGAPCRAILTKP